jgi:two-component system, OmpR family, phosphate regulon response regulator PhoB
MPRELIQIIENEPEHARLLEQAFQKEHYRTSIAYDGATGIQAVRQLIPAVVVIDLTLPGLAAYRVCRLLRKSPVTRRIPLLLITALDNPFYRAIAQQLGADDLVTKPVNLQEIVERSTHLIRRCCSMGSVPTSRLA